MKNIIVIETQIKEIVVNMFGMEKLVIMKTYPIVDCIDSLNFIRLLVEIEKNFYIKFEDEYLNMEHLEFLKDIIKYVELKWHGKSKLNKC